MKRITAILLLTIAATVAFGGYYDTKTSKLYASRKTLPYGRGQTSGLRVADDATLAKHGFLRCVTDAIPEGQHHTGGYQVEMVDGVPHRVPNTIPQAAADAQAEQAAADAIDTANAQHESEAPQGTLAAWSKPERCLLRICRKLARQIGFTDAQFNTAARAEWDKVK